MVRVFLRLVVGLMVVRPRVLFQTAVNGDERIHPLDSPSFPCGFVVRRRSDFMETFLRTSTC